MSETGSEAPLLDAIARKYCAKLLSCGAALALPEEQREALIIVAFAYGAAWALDCPDMIDTGNAMVDSLRSVKQ